MRICPELRRASLVAAAVAALGMGACPAARAKPKSQTKLATYRGAVVRFDAVSITLRDPKNPLMLRTFDYSLALREKVAKLLERSGYPYGAVVRVRYRPGTRTAIEILGKRKKHAAKPAAASKGKRK